MADTYTCEECRKEVVHGDGVWLSFENPEKPNGRRQWKHLCASCGNNLLVFRKLL